LIREPDLLRALGLERGGVVSVAGAGGKTTLIYRLAREARLAGLRVLVTSTTHMGPLPAAARGPLLLEAEQRDSGACLGRLLAEMGQVTLLGRRVREGKFRGLSPERVDELRGEADLVLVEADGARGRSLKVPADHEPVLPASTTLLLVVAAIDVLGRPLTQEWVHRVSRVRALAATDGDIVDEGVLIAALRWQRGYPAHFRCGLRSGVFLNKAEDAAGRVAAAGIAVALRPPYSLVAAGSARSGPVTLWS
jgi:probable selenium-dependent hydroxylase accessory protein YqeC